MADTYSKQQNIFAIWGSPGAGKTTLAANLAVLLADSGYMTCLVSAADYGPLSQFFGATIPENKGLHVALSSGKNVKEALTVVRNNLFILEPNTEGDAYELGNMTEKQAEEILQQLKDQFSYIIIDCTSYKESVLTGMGLVDASRVVLCVPHRDVAATWNFANEQMITALKEKLLYASVDIRDGGCNMDQMLNVLKLEDTGFDIKIPRVEKAYYYENYSTPIVLQSGKQEREYKNAVLKTIKLLLGIAEPENKKGGFFRKKPKDAPDAPKAEGNSEAKEANSRKKKKGGLFMKARKD